MSGIGGKKWEKDPVHGQPGPENFFVFKGSRPFSPPQGHWGSLGEGRQKRDPTMSLPSEEIPSVLVWEDHFYPLRQNQQEQRDPGYYLFI